MMEMDGREHATCQKSMRRDMDGIKLNVNEEKDKNAIVVFFFFFKIRDQTWEEEKELQRVRFLCF